MNNNSNENEAPNAQAINQAKAATKPGWFSGMRAPTLPQFNTSYMPSLFGGRSSRNRKNRKNRNRSERSRRNRKNRSTRKNRK